MRAPIEWLTQYSGAGLPTAELEERLTMTGTKVEAVDHHGPGSSEHFVVGRVLEARAHPDADRLSVCMVDIGNQNPLQIVCGAPNVAAGQTVAVATPGAVMPDGTTLGKVKLRGVESNGMILAEDELAIGTEHAGILVLEQDGAEPGTALEGVIPFATDVLVLEVTPNRPDCLGIYGVAREVHASTGSPLEPPSWAEDPGTAGAVQGAAVVVECPDLCPRFTARVFEDVELGPSPPWLKARLMAAGQRPISNVVDISNYVMLETGQPVHAFDLDRVAGAQLTVRRARPGERMETLDGQQRILDENMVVIEDGDGPTSIAGIMGGARSEVHDGTARVLMEAANWHGANIHRSSLKLGLRTEASTRFEKQLQPEQAMDAQALATRLMIELCGARVREGTIDVGGPGPDPITIRLREQRVSGLLGAPIARERCREILEALGFRVADAPDGLDVKPPAFRRADVTREADVIEEVARLDGLDKLPATLPSRHGASGRLTARQRLRRSAADALTAQGLNEIVGWSFTGPDLYERLRTEPPAVVELANPLSGDQAQLRTTLLGSLLDAAARNRAHGASALRLFEMGAVYLPSDGLLPHEPYHVAALIAGPVRPPTWREPEPPRADFFAAKGVLQGLLDRLGIEWALEPAQRPFLHPARAASVLVGGQPAGWVGELHPAVADEIAAFELDLDTVGEPSTATYADVTSFPAVREDLAVVVGEETSAAAVMATVREAGAPLLADVDVFDVYRDPERIGAGKVSLALRLTYRAPERTLTDEEVAAKRADITAALERQLGGAIRASSVSVFGAGGFTGALAARLLFRHPFFELRALTARSDVGRGLSELYPQHRVPLVLEEFDLDRHADVDAAVVAYPHGASAPIVAELLQRGVKVVDLSADFRLRDRATYAHWYREHPVPELIEQAVYGLPELGYRDQIAGADLVANPGCYPTAALLALAPLAREGVIEDVVIDAKSGVSGAGRAATEATHFVTVDENVSAYGVAGHRHTPEIEQELGMLGADLRVTFTPHLVPLDQGELVSCYVTVADGFELGELYDDAYEAEPFIELADTPPGVRDVRETNICRISVHADERSGRAIVFAAIDNLWKGAASQAVQNLNLMFGLPEGEGIA